MLAHNCTTCIADILRVHIENNWNSNPKSCVAHHCIKCIANKLRVQVRTNEFEPKSLLADDCTKCMANTFRVHGDNNWNSNPKPCLLTTLLNALQTYLEYTWKPTTETRTPNPACPQRCKELQPALAFMHSPQPQHPCNPAGNDSNQHWDPWIHHNP